MKLSSTEVERLQASLPLWRYEAERGGILTRELVFRDFAEAMGFMTEAAVHADKRGHHPEWRNVYNRVWVTLTTHDAGGLTARDAELAHLIDSIAARRIANE